MAKVDIKMATKDFDGSLAKIKSLKSVCEETNTLMQNVKASVDGVKSLETAQLGDKVGDIENDLATSIMKTVDALSALADKVEKGVRAMQASQELADSEALRKSL